MNSEDKSLGVAEEQNLARKGRIDALVEIASQGTSITEDIPKALHPRPQAFSRDNSRDSFTHSSSSRESSRDYIARRSLQVAEMNKSRNSSFALSLDRSRIDSSESVELRENSLDMIKDGSAYRW